jgi:hypothetical protein
LKSLFMFRNKPDDKFVSAGLTQEVERFEELKN